MTYCEKSNQPAYPFILPNLPFGKSDFEPHLTAESFDYHHGKHHQTYVTNVNNLLQNEPSWHNQDLEKVIMASSKSSQAIFNNAAQVWNHSFFWHSIKPNGGGKPNSELLKQIEQDFGSFEDFCTSFKQAATSQFGSGWAWLVWSDNKLQVIKTSNADTPIVNGITPLLACDVWEHAYYIDYRNKRPDYVATYLEHLVNWEFASSNLNKGRARR